MRASLGGRTQPRYVVPFLHRALRSWWSPLKNHHCFTVHGVGGLLKNHHAAGRDCRDRCKRARQRLALD